MRRPDFVMAIETAFGKTEFARQFLKLVLTESMLIDEFP